MSRVRLNFQRAGFSEVAAHQLQPALLRGGQNFDLNLELCACKSGYDQQC